MDAFGVEERASGEMGVELATAGLGAGAVGAGEQERKLVAAEPAADLVVGELAMQPAADLGERGAAADVPMRVDEALEAVHVEEDDRERLLAGDGLLETADEVLRVAEAGQGVVLGQLDDCLVGSCVVNRDGGEVGEALQDLDVAGVEDALVQRVD